jgi:hypothetical protein
VTDGVTDERVVGGAEQVRERVAQRRSDVAVKSVFRGHGPSEGAQSVLEATGDPGAGIGERAVEIEEDEQGGSLA